MLLIGGLNFGGVAQSYSSRTTWDWSALWWDRSKFCRILERSQSLMFHVARCDDIWDRSRSLWWFHKWSNHVCNATRGKMKVCFGCWFKEFLWKLRIEWFALTGCLRFRFRAGKFSFSFKKMMAFSEFAAEAEGSTRESPCATAKVSDRMRKWAVHSSYAGIHLSTSTHAKGSGILTHLWWNGVFLEHFRNISAAGKVCRGPSPFVNESVDFRYGRSRDAAAANPRESRGVGEGRCGGNWQNTKEKKRKFLVREGDWCSFHWNKCRNETLFLLIETLTLQFWEGKWPCLSWLMKHRHSLETPLWFLVSREP